MPFYPSYGPISPCGRSLTTWALRSRARCFIGTSGLPEMVKGREPLLRFLVPGRRRAAPRPVVRRPCVGLALGGLEVALGAPSDPELAPVPGLLLARGLARLVGWLNGDDPAAAIAALQPVPGNETLGRGRCAGRGWRWDCRSGERVPGRHAEPAVCRTVLAARRRVAIHKRAGDRFVLKTRIGRNAGLQAPVGIR